MRHPYRVITFVHRNGAWRPGHTSHHAQILSPAHLGRIVKKASQSGCVAVALPQRRRPGQEWENSLDFAFCQPGGKPFGRKIPENGWPAWMQEKFGLSSEVAER